MVSKLVFKGEKPKKKRKVASSESARERAADATQKDEGEEVGWASAKEWADLAGPVMIVANLDGDIGVVASDLQGKLYTSFELDLMGNGAHSAEPQNVQQVFVLVPLSTLSGSSTSESKFAYALKSSEGKYLTVDSSGAISCRASAMGQAQTFTLEKQKDSSTWKVRTHLDTLVVVSKSAKSQSGYEVGTGASADGVAEFVVRVQPRHRIEEKAVAEGEKYEKISTKVLDEMAGRRLTNDEVKMLKRAHREGKLNEALLDLRQKGRSDSRC